MTDAGFERVEMVIDCFNFLRGLRKTIVIKYAVLKFVETIFLSLKVEEFYDVVFLAIKSSVSTYLCTAYNAKNLMVSIFNSCFFNMKI